MPTLTAPSNPRRITIVTDGQRSSSQCLYDDYDLNSKMERDTLAGLAAPIYEKILPVVQQALEASGLTKDQIFAVEVTGNSRPIPSFQTGEQPTQYTLHDTNTHSSHRIRRISGGSRRHCSRASAVFSSPKWAWSPVRTVLSAISDWFGKKCNTTFDASGGLARGAALTAAMLSPAFKVREFKIVDKTPYAVTLIWQPVNATKEQVRPQPKASAPASRAHCSGAAP